MHHDWNSGPSNSHTHNFLLICKAYLWVWGRENIYLMHFNKSKANCSLAWRACPAVVLSRNQFSFSCYSEPLSFIGYSSFFRYWEIWVIMTNLQGQNYYLHLTNEELRLSNTHSFVQSCPASKELSQVSNSGLYIFLKAFAFCFWTLLNDYLRRK